MGKHSNWIFQPGDTFRIKGIPGKDGRREIVKDVLGNLYAEGPDGVRYRLSDNAAAYRETGYHFRQHTGLTKDTAQEVQNFVASATTIAYAQPAYAPAQTEITAPPGARTVEVWINDVKEYEGPISRPIRLVYGSVAIDQFSPSSSMGWVFADGDRFFFEVGEYSYERRVSTRPDVPGAKGPVQRGESDFLVTDAEGNYSGRLPMDASMYRMRGHNFRHHPEFASRAPGTEDPTEEELENCGPGVWCADETAPVPIEEADPVLVWLLRHAGEEWGPRGVAEAAAQLAGWVGPF